MNNLDIKKIISEKKTVFTAIRFRPTISNILAKLAEKDNLSIPDKIERYILEDYEKNLEKKE